MENRVYCLYRVSTGKQVDYDDRNQADIPMQRRECHRFAEEHGWVIIHEEQEDGVSGHKVRAENRDKLQIIKEHARQGKFDILLVFMFDRVGRIADETPFVVEWFVRNGIRVWSTQEGEQRIATWLNGQGYRARSGKPWHHASIRGILCNPTYTGVLRSGESRSPVQESLQIVSPEQFEAAQRIRVSRAESASSQPHVPMNTRGSSLLSGNVYCGHCGARLALTTNGKPYPCKDDPNRVVKRIRYICYGKTLKQTECDGQTGYTAHILDGIVDKVVRHVFSQMKTVSKGEIVSRSYRERMQERKVLMEVSKKELAKAAEELATLRAEVVKAIRGESAFTSETLGYLIREAEEKCVVLEQKSMAAQAAYDEGQTLVASLNAQYDAIIGWSELYELASMETKKMIVNCLIKRIDVYRGYRVHIEFGIDFEQFQYGLDLNAKPA